MNMHIVDYGEMKVKEGIKIRKGKEEDIEKLWPIEIESRIYHKRITDKKYFRLTKSKINKKAELEFIKRFKKDLKKKKNFLLVAEKNKEIVGYIFACFGKWGWSDNPPKDVFINDLGIIKKYRRKGIATKLIKEIEKIAKNKGFLFSSLNMWIKNKIAYNLYKKNKYDDFFIIMVKKLK